MSDPAPSAASTPPECADEAPFPPRYWWTKRIAIAAGAWVVFLIVARLWWGWYAHRQLQAAIDKIIAAGEPIYPQDFDPPEPIPDDQNAAKLLMEAAENLTIPPLQKPEDNPLIEEIRQDPTALGRRWDEVRTLIESNAEVLELVHKARLCPGVNWETRPPSPTDALYLPPWSYISRADLDDFCSIAASYYHRRGADATVVRILRDMVGHAGAVSSGVGWYSHGTANGVCTRVALRVEEISPCLSIRPEGAITAKGSSAAPSEEVRALIRELLNDRNARDGFIRDMQYNRMFDLYTTQEIASGQVSVFRDLTSSNPPWRERLRWYLSGYSPAGWEGISWERPVILIIRPAYDLEAAFAVKWTTRYVEAVHYPNCTEAVRVAPGEAAYAEGWRQMAHPTAWGVRWPVKGIIVNHFRVIALRRMAAAALGIRLYEVAQGHTPPSLADLVPDYLLEVPLDPFADDGRTIRYAPDAWPPVLYSVGANGTDDGGTYTIESAYDWWWKDTPDIPFFLDGYRPNGSESEQKRPASRGCSTATDRERPE